MLQADARGWATRPWVVRHWALWQLLPKARVYVLAIDTAFVAAVVAGLLSRPLRADDLRTAVVLVVCAMLSIEGSLRFVWRRAKPGPINDLMGVWTLPMALLLPPGLAALVIVPLEAFFYLRVMRRAPHKWVFNVACLGLAGFLAAQAHEALATTQVWTVDTLVGTGTAIFATLVCAAVRQSANFVLVANVVALSKPGSFRFRDTVHDVEAVGTLVAETCTGVLVAIACVASPYSVLLAIPPVLVLQRTLLLAEFREAARTDQKTGLANSTYWREVAERAITRARGGRDPLAVLLCDIDHFKAVNDRYGHLTGDDALRAVANALTDGLRPHDFVGRFGGEEFVVLLTGSDLEQARHAAERIREHVAALRVDTSNGRDPVKLTISVGVAAFRESGHSINELLDAADIALYAAKAAGRDCVRVAEGARQQMLDLTGEPTSVIDLRDQRVRAE